MDWLRMQISYSFDLLDSWSGICGPGGKGLVEELDVLGFYFYGGGEVACGEGDE